MSRFLLLWHFVWVFLSWAVLSQTVTPRKMVLCAVDGPEKNSLVQSSRELPTWAQVVDVKAAVDAGTPMTIEAVRRYAEECFEWLKLQPNWATKNRYAGLVNGWYMPWAKKIVLTTIPRPAFIGRMTITKDHAPIWANSMRDYNFAKEKESGAKEVKFHAEDATMYLGERLTRRMLGECSDKYPDYSVMAAFGQWENEIDPKMPGHAIAPCGSSPRARKPSCQTITKSTNIYTSKWKPEWAKNLPEGPPQQETAEEALATDGVSQFLDWESLDAAMRAAADDDTLDFIAENPDAFEDMETID